MYERILVPTDGSEGARRAVKYALDLAAQYDAELHAVYVVQTNVVPDISPGEFVNESEKQGNEAVGEIADQARDAGIETIRTAVVQGVPHRAILEYVDDEDIDVVVMGTHGRAGLDRYLLGSVTEKVVRLSDVPVLTVRMADGESE
jgi:nucleotide-binding universal stress UspA family protein